VGRYETPHRIEAALYSDVWKFISWRAANIVNAHNPLTNVNRSAENDESQISPFNAKYAQPALQYKWVQRFRDVLVAYDPFR
jgi:hypothetical protein